MTTDPKLSPIGLREWAIETINQYSVIPLPESAKNDLKNKRLIVPRITIDDGATFKGNIEMPEDLVIEGDLSKDQNLVIEGIKKGAIKRGVIEADIKPSKTEN